MYLKGDALWKKGRVKDAVQFFQAAVEEWPEDQQALWALGNCYSALKKHRKAEDAFRQALAVGANVDRITLLFNLANTLFDQQRYAEARLIYSEIPSSHPLSAKATKNAAFAKARSD